MGGSSKAGAAEVEIIRYQVLIPVTEVQVKNNPKDSDSHFLWELIHLRSQMQRRSEKVYHLSNSTNEFRNAFLRTILQIIRESVRNMTVPVNKPVSKDKSGGGSGGGGSSSGRRSGPESGTASMARTLSGKKRPKSVQRHSAGAMEQEVAVETYDNLEQNFHTRSKTVTDGMDDIDAERSDRSDRSDKSDHLHRLHGNKLSNSIGKGGLIYVQAAHDKTSSPVWKLRGENDKSATLPHPPKGHHHHQHSQQYYDANAPLYKKDHCTSSGLSKPPLEC